MAHPRTLSRTTSVHSTLETERGPIRSPLPCPSPRPVGEFAASFVPWRNHQWIPSDPLDCVGKGLSSYGPRMIGREQIGPCHQDTFVVPQPSLHSNPTCLSVVKRTRPLKLRKRFLRGPRSGEQIRASSSGKASKYSLR